MATTSSAHLLAHGDVPAAFGSGSGNPGGVLPPASHWERAAPIPPGTEAGNGTSLRVLSLPKQDLA